MANLRWILTYKLKGSQFLIFLYKKQSILKRHLTYSNSNANNKKKKIKSVKVNVHNQSYTHYIVWLYVYGFTMHERVSLMTSKDRDRDGECVAMCVCVCLMALEVGFFPRVPISWGLGLRELSPWSIPGPVKRSSPLWECHVPPRAVLTNRVYIDTW